MHDIVRDFTLASYPSSKLQVLQRSFVSTLISTASHENPKAHTIVLNYVQKQLQGHGHWVNTLALSTEHCLKTGPFDHKGNRPKTDEDAKKVAREKYEECLGKWT